jgi:chemotaxis-related protein WspD
MTESSLPHPSAAPQTDLASRPVNECWRTIGVTGDRSCRELEIYVHCRNCPVMAEAARAFFDREAPEGYLESWSGILEEPGASAEPSPLGVLVFRLGKEWLALPTMVLVEVTTERTCHTVPHRTTGLLNGLVNIRGQLQLCVSAHRLLGLDPAESADGPIRPDAEPSSLPGNDASTRRLLVVERLGRAGQDRWVFGVDQVAGVHRVELPTLRAVPATVSQSGARFCHALFDWQGLVVGMLDESRFFDGLHEQIQRG